MKTILRTSRIAFGGGEEYHPVHSTVRNFEEHVNEVEVELEVLVMVVVEEEDLEAFIVMVM